MNQMMITQSIQQFAFQGIANQQKSPDVALVEATKAVEEMLARAKALADQHGANPSITFQSIQQFVFQGMAQGKEQTKAVEDAVATVGSMLLTAADLAKKYGS